MPGMECRLPEAWEEVARGAELSTTGILIEWLPSEGVACTADRLAAVSCWLLLSMLAVSGVKAVGSLRCVSWFMVVLTHCELSGGF